MSLDYKLRSLSTMRSFLINYSVQRKLNKLQFNFNITKPTTYNWNTSKHYLQNHHGNWGLWEYDVIEFFIQPRENDSQILSPYYEFQLSPSNQTFELIIKSPRKCTFSPLKSNMQFKCQHKADLWSGEVTLVLPDSKYYYGDVCAVLGEQNNREYYSFATDDDIIDFHRPQNFKKF